MALGPSLWTKIGSFQETHGAQNSNFCWFWDPGSGHITQNRAPSPHSTEFGVRRFEFLSFLPTFDFCNNARPGTEEMTTTVQKTARNNIDSYSLAFYVFGDSRKHYFSASPEIIDIARCSLLLELEEGGVDADYFCLV